MPWTRLSYRLSASCLCAIAALTPHVTSATLTADQIAIIVNGNDPTSVEVGEYYAAQRRIPAANVVHVNFPHKVPSINSDTFKRVFHHVQKQTPPHVQAYGLTWTLPYRVDCMSITSAFALGYATRYCAKVAGRPYQTLTSTAQAFSRIPIIGSAQQWRLRLKRSKMQRSSSTEASSRISHILSG
jgi:hypothetical protein